MIGIFDSGIGGLSVFREIYRVLPEQKYIYFADSAHCPYGEKSREYVVDRARRISEFLISEGADIIVVACNTATAAAISVLRNEYSDPGIKGTAGHVLGISNGRTDHVKFIGMEPAVKPAAEITESGVIGVLATAGTLNGAKYRTTREMFAKEVDVVEHVGEGFVELVERGVTEGPEAEDTVKESIRPLLDAGADVIVLGCTHYPFLMQTIRKIAGPDVRIIDPAPAVAKHLVEVMTADGLLNSLGTDSAQQQPAIAVPDIRLYSSGNPQVLEAAFSRLIKKRPETTCRTMAVTE